MKKILLVLLSIMFLLSSIPVSASADTGLSKELESAKVEGEPFDFADYPKNTNGTAELITVLETGYGTSGPTESFGLYLYIYNPTETTVIAAGKNKVNIATAFDKDGKATTYDVFDLKYVESIENNRFLKFKVVDRIGSDGLYLYQRVKKTGRKYSISQFNLHYIGNTNATAFSVGETYTFTGSALNSDLAHTVSSFTTYSAPVTYTYFRTQTSDAGVGHQNQLNSVYFSVPNEYLKPTLGGFLSRIKVTWNEQKTAPVFVTTNQSIYNAMLPYVGQDIGQTNDSIPFLIRSYRTSTVLGSNTTKYDYAYNYYNFLTGPRNQITNLAYVFKTDDFEEGKISVLFEDLNAWINKYNKASWLFSDEVDKGRTKGENVKEIPFTDKFDLVSFYDSMGAIGQKLYEVFGFVPDESYEGLQSFHCVTSTDVAQSPADIANVLCVSLEAAQDIKTKYVEATANDETIVIFRYAETDYFTEHLMYSNEEAEVREEMYFAQETIFFDWSMIELEFDLNGEKTVIPYVMNPEDYGGDITDSPYVGAKDELDLSWLKPFIALLGILAAIVICREPLTAAFDSLGNISSGLLGGSSRRSSSRNNRRKRK